MCVFMFRDVFSIVGVGFCTVYICRDVFSAVRVVRFRGMFSAAIVGFHVYFIGVGFHL